MNDDKQRAIIDWEGAGYFGFPFEAMHSDFLLANLPDDYGSWLVAFEHATNGDFGLVPNLLEIYDRSSDYIIEHLCSTLLGDAGVSSCFSNIANRITKEFVITRRYELIIDYCNALFSRGRLGDIPLILSAYESHSSIDEMGIIPCYISELLEYPVGQLTDPANFSSPVEYHNAVISRQQELIASFGNEDVLIFGGKTFAVVSYAHMLLDRFQHPHVQSFWRRKFEACTGVNCSSFYDNGIFQPLSATAIVEDFLNSQEAKKYEDGFRYFFGHRIPG